MTGDEVRTILSTRIKEIRMLQGISQQQLAEKADISLPFISAIERGQKWPYPETLAKIAEALNVQIADLFFDKNSTKPEADVVKIFKELIEGQQKLLSDLSEKYLEK